MTTERQKYYSTVQASLLAEVLRIDDELALRAWQIFDAGYTPDRLYQIDERRRLLRLRQELKQALQEETDNGK